MKLHSAALLSGFIYSAKAVGIFQGDSCPDDCSGNGQCVDGAQPACSCNAGFFLQNCSLDLGNNKYVVATEVFFGLFFFSILYLCCYVFFKTPTNTSTTLTPITNLRKMTFACVAVVCLSQLAFVVDPLHVHGLYHRVAIQILYAIPYLMFLVIYISTLFHWIELINTSVHSMKKEAMFQKINKSYQPKEVTVEEVIEQVKFLRKLLIPYAIVIGLLFAIILALSILIGLEIKMLALRLVLQSVISLHWLVIFICYIIYGRKLEELMPPQLYDKVNKLWWRISLLSLLFFLATTGIFLGFATAGRTDVIAFISLCLAHETFWAVACILTLVIFVHWESYFPSLFNWKKSSTGTLMTLSPQVSDISITLPPELFASTSLARTLSTLKIKRIGIDFTQPPHNSSSSYCGESPEGSPVGSSPISDGSTRSRSNTPLHKTYLKTIREPSDNDINQISMDSIGVTRKAEEQDSSTEDNDDQTETHSVDSQKTEPQPPVPTVAPFDWLSVGTGRKLAYPIQYDTNFSRSFSLRTTEVAEQVSSPRMRSNT